MRETGWVAALERLSAAGLRVEIRLTGNTATVMVPMGDGLVIQETAPGPAASSIPRCMRLIMNAPEIIGRFNRDT